MYSFVVAEINLRLGRFAFASIFRRISALNEAILKLLVNNSVAEGVLGFLIVFLTRVFSFSGALCVSVVFISWVSATCFTLLGVSTFSASESGLLTSSTVIFSTTSFLTGAGSGTSASADAGSGGWGGSASIGGGDVISGLGSGKGAGIGAAGFATSSTLPPPSRFA